MQHQVVHCMQTGPEGVDISATATELTGLAAGPGSRPRQRWRKLLLLLAALLFSAAAFFVLDWFYTARVQRYPQPAMASSPCHVPDRIRHHAFKPNCASIERWGQDSYEFFTNSLGLRDQRVQEIPLSDPRPRVLLLGDSFTEGKLRWSNSYAGKIAANLPQYDFLNGGVASYAPSNYLNTARLLLATGVGFDEVIVFADISDVQDEAAFYHDIDGTGAVSGPAHGRRPNSRYAWWHWRLVNDFRLTSYVVGYMERLLVSLGFYHLTWDQYGNVFDVERAAWTYRKVNEADPYTAGYAPLGVEGGITKEKAKMDLLWSELRQRGIPLSVVVYPYPAQLVHDTVDSRQVRIWREWCEGKCRRFINLFPAFFAAKDRCTWLQPGCWYPSNFVFGDSHYNAAGNALVAGAVVRSLTAEPPAKAGLDSPH
jgi:hypothetical protein